MILNIYHTVMFQYKIKHLRLIFTYIMYYEIAILSNNLNSLGIIMYHKKYIHLKKINKNTLIIIHPYKLTLHVSDT